MDEAGFRILGFHDWVLKCDLGYIASELLEAFLKCGLSDVAGAPTIPDEKIACLCDALSLWTVRSAALLRAQSTIRSLALPLLVLKPSDKKPLFVLLAITASPPTIIASSIRWTGTW